MVQIAVSPEEAAVLRDVLEDYLSDLRMEIADTERMEFREHLKKREEILRKLQDRIPAEGA
jgi:hypothetical protein